MKVLAILTHSLRPDKPNFISGVDFWRIWRPMLELQKQTDWQIDIRYKWVEDEENPDKELEEIGNTYDILFTSYIRNPIAFAYAKVLTNKFKIKHIMDVDDDVIDIPPDNPARQVIPEGSMEHFALMHSVRDVDYITTTNELLANTYRKFRQQPAKGLETKDPTSVFVAKNYIDTSFYPTIKPKKPTDVVRIGYMGSAHHHDDLHETGFFDAIRYILKKHKNVEFTTVGMPLLVPEKDYKVWKHKRYIPQEPKSPNEGWDKLFAEQDLDIVVAPLEDKPFNHRKSNIKMQEAGLSGACFVASNVTPYRESVIGGRTGVLTANTRNSWINTLTDLIEDPKKRQELAKNNQESVLNNYALDKKWKVYQEIFNKVKSKGVILT
jgi:glycosyltransferase involved in cell wall biosynthesis